MREDHDTIRGEFDAYSAGELDDVSWVTVRTHLAECDQCRSEVSRTPLWNRASPRRIRPGERATGPEEPPDTEPTVPEMAPLEPVEVDWGWPVGDEAEDTGREQPGPAGFPMRSTRPGWPVVFGTSLVAAMVAYGLGYAIGSTPW